nr:phosphopyruvate hydratase [Bacteriovoracaceae bacterium]
MIEIKKIHARQILDSRGNPTVEVDIISSNNSVATAAVPSGASTGSREALELRDGDKNNYLGKSVHKAVGFVNNELNSALQGMDIFAQAEVDHKMLELEGTEFKSKWGANALLGISLALARLGAQEKKKPLYAYLYEDLKCPNKENRFTLPAPMMNIINGGAHASNNLDIQEFMIIPHMGKSFSENLRAGVEVFHYLKKELSAKKYSTNVGDEGGFAPNLSSHEEGMELILKSIEKAGYKPAQDISLCLDVAASEFYKDGNYQMQGKTFSSLEMIHYFATFVEKYPLYSIED